MNVVRFMIGIVAFVLLLGFVGQEDVKDLDGEQALYCDRVASGIWPDFKNIFEKECK